MYSRPFKDSFIGVKRDRYISPPKEGGGGGFRAEYLVYKKYTEDIVCIPETEDGNRRNGSIFRYVYIHKEICLGDGKSRKTEERENGKMGKKEFLYSDSSQALPFTAPSTSFSQLPPSSLLHQTYAASSRA